MAARLVFALAVCGMAQAHRFGWDPQASMEAPRFQEDADNLSIRFDREFVAAYGKTLCSLYQAWNPQSEEAGSMYPVPLHYHQPTKSVWEVRRGKRSILERVAFSANTSVPGAFSLHYTLYLEDGGRIAVAESPRYDAHYGGPRLMRNLEITGISRGEQLRLRLSGHSERVLYRLSGGGEIERKEGVATLVITRDGFSQALLLWDL